MTSNPAGSKHFSYRPDIDGLRAIAVLSVLLFHAFPNLLPGGFVGVDIFFVISGFLISGILFKDAEADRFSFTDFYVRRIRRIFPALFLVIVATLVLGWFFLLAGEYSTLGRHTFASTFFVQNINLLRESGYFDSSADQKPLLHLWSLAIEEQFYLFWPVAILFFYKKRKLAWRTFLFITTTASFIYSVRNSHVHPALAFYDLRSRFWELMAGGLLAYIPRDLALATIFQRVNKRELRETLSVVSIGLIVYACFAFNSEIPFPGVAALIPVLASTLLVAMPDTFINRRLLSMRALVWTGLISYPLYLWHWPLLSFCHITMPADFMARSEGTNLKLLCLLFSFALAAATYYFAEKPLREARSISFKRSALVLLLLLFAAGLAGYAIENQSGFPKRASAVLPDFKDFDQSGSVPPSHLKDCSTKPKGVEICRTTDESKTDVVIIGDSHGLGYSDALARYYAKSGLALTVFETGDTIGLIDTGVMMGDHLSIDGVHRSLNFAFYWAFEHGAKKVVLISRGPSYVEAHGFGLDQRKPAIADLTLPTEKNPKAIFASGLRRTFKAALNSGAEVVFVYDNPEFPFDPPSACFSRPLTPLKVDHPLKCEVSRQTVDARQANYRRIVQDVLRDFPAVKTFDPNPILCEDGSCFAIKNHALIYGDYNHLNLTGAEQVIQFYKY